MKKLCLILMLLISFQLFADKPRLAVMNFVDETDGELSERIIKGGSKLIRSRITRKAKKYFEMVTDEENEKALAAMKKKSYTLDRDKAYQIELGRQVSAAKIIIPTITYVDEDKFLITALLIDIKRGVDENSVDDFFNGTTDGLIEAVDTIIIQLLETAEEELETIAYREASNEDTIRGWDQYLLIYGDINQKHSNKAEDRISYLKEQEEIQQARDKDAAAEAETKEKREKTLKVMRKNAKAMKISGITLLVGGSVILIAGTTGFAIGSDKEYEKFKQFKIGNPFIARKHLDKSKTYKSMAITSGVIGAAIAGTGITLLVIGIKKENEKIALDNISAIPTNDGFYASVGFNF